MERWRLLLFLFVVFFGFFGFVREGHAKPRRVLFDTDVNSDDIYALIYFLKQNLSEIDIEAITISANAFSNAGHAVNHIYDVLHMMGRDDIPVGVGGEGGILPNGTILSNVGGYLPLIEQDMSTAGNCRYRQAIYRGEGGLLSVDTNYGLRRKFLPMGDRHYSPLHQPTAQKVMIDAISAGPITVFLSGSHTNLAIFLMTQPHLKQNIKHIYAMGGGVRSKSPFGCCTEDSGTSCQPSRFCGDTGNLYTGQASNPYAEFNIFTDPFAAYQVFHSGIPVTLVPLDATNTIPVNEEFFTAFQQHRSTYEAEYCFQMLNIIRDTWFDNSFYKSYFMWDSFAAGVTVSSMKNEHHEDENEFAEMEYMNLTVVTSNKPHGVYDGSNPFFDNRATPKFGLQKNGVHSGHVQTELHDPFCHVDGIEKGICQDGYTKEEKGAGVRVLVATKAKLNNDKQSILDRKYYVSFLNALNQPQQSARLNRTSQLPYYREILHKPSYKHTVLGKPVVFDMDMSVGDLVALIYLLKVPVEEINIKGILVNGNGWANAATIDIVYDVLHMMGRDDIPVGLGSFTALGTPSHSCKYVKAIPHGSGGLIDSDTLFGLARNLPQSPRRYTVGDDRQPSAMEVWQMISRSLDQNNTINILTNGPLTNIANIILSYENASSVIQRIYIVGGHIIEDQEKGNVFTSSSNEYAEFNMFLDPLAAKTVIESKLDVTLIPLDAQRKVASFGLILSQLQQKLKTAESVFVHHLLSRLHNLQKRHKAYNHMDIFLGEILGAVFMAASDHLNPIIKAKPLNVLAGNINTDGQTIVNEGQGKIVDVLESLDSEAYYHNFAKLLEERKQSAVISRFAKQNKMWRMAPNAS